MRAWKITSVVCVLCLSLLECGKQAQSVSEPEKLVNQFFDEYRRKGPRTSLQQLLSANKYIDATVVDSVAIRAERMTKRLGDYLGYEKVSEVTYGPSMTYFVYVVKYSRIPIRFDFLYYKPVEDWKLQNFSFDAPDFPEELKQIGKRKMFPEN